jgi:hypothetical protein
MLGADLAQAHAVLGDARSNLSQGLRREIFTAFGESLPPDWETSDAWLAILAKKDIVRNSQAETYCVAVTKVFDFGSLGSLIVFGQRCQGTLRATLSGYSNCVRATLLF